MPERFIPSLGQIRAASEELPDPEIWPDNEYTVPIESGKLVQELAFQRVKFTRSNGRTYRWVYEGKVLIRLHQSASEND